MHDNVVSNHQYTDVKSVEGKTNTGDNNCADTAENYQDDNPASGSDFTYPTNNLVTCYYDFDEDGYYSSAKTYGQNALNVGIWCLPGKYDGSQNGMSHHEEYGPSIFGEGDDPNDCDDSVVGNKPTVPTIKGPSEGKTGTEYDYTFVSTTPDGSDVYYYIDWGDGEVEEWIGPYSSGEEVTVGHTWSSKDTYSVRAKAKDTSDVESDWGTLSVTMPKSRTLYLPILQKILENHPLLKILFNFFYVK
jgi:hypothetical protein